MFTTSNRYNGDLITEAINNFAACSGVTTGLDAADCICQEHADSVGLNALYAAWLADDSGSPDTRFVQSFVQPYVRIDNKLVANDWTDLTDGSIANPLNIDENGNAIPTSTTVVWTHVRTNGTTDGGATDDCINWTGGQSFSFGGVGRHGSTGGTWTDVNALANCSVALSLYCFEQ